MTRTLVSLLACVACSATAQPSAVRDVLKWRGHYTDTGRMTQADLGPLPPAVSIELDYTSSFSIDFEVERVQSDPPRWEGRVTGSNITMKYHEVLTAGECVQTFEGQTSGPLDPLDAVSFKVEAAVDANPSDFIVHIYRNKRMATFTHTTKCPNYNNTSSDEASVFYPWISEDLPYPSGVTVLEGSNSMTNEITSWG